MPARIAPETVARMADEVVGTPIKEADRPRLLDELQFLAGDMVALKAMKVGPAEPALVYDAAEAES